MTTDLWHGTSGPQNAPIVLVGEAWGQEEWANQKPFVGSAGIELRRLLAEAGLNFDDMLVTNTVAARPQGNDMWRFFHAKEEESPERRFRGLYPTQIVRDEVRRLGDQIRAQPRQLVIAAGNYPLWALTNCSRVNNGKSETGYRKTPAGIGDWRGSMWWCLENPHDDTSTKYSTTKLLPLYHPSGIMRAWDTRSVTLHDLKARVKMALSGSWRPNPAPVFFAPPTFAECVSRLNYWLTKAESGQIFTLATDVETVRKSLLSCIGFADSKHFAMSIPFLRPTGPKTFTSYWTPRQEAEIVYLIRKVLIHPNINVVGQNFLYDVQWCDEEFAMKMPMFSFDSMLAQNVLFPGTPKDLGYLSSLYCEYHWYWKDDQKDWDSVDDLPRLLEYNCLDNIRTFEVVEQQQLVIQQMGMETQMRDKMRIARMCLQMMRKGIRYDRQRALTLAIELQEARAKVHQKLESMVPQWVVGETKGARWYTSDKQTATLFYDILGFPIVKDRKTGNRTVNKEALNILPKKQRIWNPMFEALKLERSLENSYNVMMSGVDRDGRMRCYFNPGGTETHRLSSSKNAWGRGMNLQNLTKGKED